MGCRWDTPIRWDLMTPLAKKCLENDLVRERAKHHAQAVRLNEFKRKNKWCWQCEEMLPLNRFRTGEANRRWAGCCATCKSIYNSRYRERAA